jgi:carboxyl-terminal processing protease
MSRSRAVIASILAMVIAGGCVDALVGGNPSDTPATVFDRVWADFDRNYSFFEYKNIDWDAVHAKYAGKAQAAKSLNALAPVIGEMFRELNDVHVDLVTPSVVYHSVDFASTHTFFSAPTILKNYVPSSTMTPSHNIRYGKLASDVGWIWIASFGGDEWGDEIDEAIAGLGNVSGLVIDVRNNGGGSTRNSEPIANRFVTEERVFTYVQYRNGPRHSDFTELASRSVRPMGKGFAGKVAVLLNRGCASATESFLLGVKTNPTIVLVGDTSIGGMGNPMTRELPNNWAYRLPQWIQYDANLRILENIGIAPDVVVPMTAADSAAGRDLQLERALALVRP